jgi:rhamnulokinase/L-fuculokinase
MKRVLAFDFGASSGRAMIAALNSGKIEMSEIHRFPNDPVEVNGVLYWDVLRLLFEVKQAIVKAQNSGGFDAISIDTWGVDFGLLDKEGHLIQNPVHYRDVRTDGIMDEAFEIIPKEELYARTGIQFLRFNTLFQLFYLKKYKPYLLEQADKMLFMPDLFACFLTGEKKTEYTIASTSQMINAETGDWDRELLDRMGIPPSILTDICEPGTINGYLRDSICEELGCKKVPVISVCGHDTASAVAAVPARDDDFIYISCGTWSLFGTEAKKPVINDAAYRFQFTNEGGYGRTVRLLKNIMGLWLIQESRRQWQRKGTNLSFGEIMEQARQVPTGKFYIDCDYSEFDKPGNMPQKIARYCEENSFPVPKTVGEVAMCIYESLAVKYKKTLDMISELTGIKYNTINLIGGGANAELLCQLTADKCGVSVIAGPIEATAIGNVAVALIALGEIKDLKEARNIIAGSFDVKVYNPRQ